MEHHLPEILKTCTTYVLSRRLEGTGVTANVFHPGLGESNLTNEMPAILNFIFKYISSKPDIAARMLCSLAIDDKYSNSNSKFYKFNGKEIKSSSYSNDKELQEKLWMISEQLSSKKTIKKIITFFISAREIKMYLTNNFKLHHLSIDPL